MTGEGGVSRERFLKLAGAAGAGIALGGTAWVAKAKTVRAQAKTTGKLSAYCIGDGSDETAQIQKCFDEHLIVEVDAPPGGIGYGFAGGLSIRVRSGQEVRGIGDAAKLIRVPGTSGTEPRSGVPLNRCFLNKDEVNGSQGLIFENLHIEGQGRTDLESMWDNNFREPRLVGAAFTLLTYRTEKASSDVNLTDVTVVEWPGQSIKSQNIAGWYATRVYSRDPARGAHVLSGKLRGVKIHSCESTESGDDSFALNPGMKGKRRLIVGEDLYAHEFEIWDCTTSTRQSKIDNGGGNNGIAVRGARSGSVQRCKVYNTAKNGYAIEAYFGYQPKKVLVLDCEGRKIRRSGIGVRASKTSFIRLRNNTIDGCRDYGTSWTTPKSDTVRFAGCRDSGTLVSRAGKGERYIEPNIRGIKLS